MLIPFKVGKRTYQLPGSWGELTFEQLTGYTQHIGNFNKLVGYLLNCDEPIDASAAVPFLQWLTEPLDLKSFKASNEVGDLRRKPWKIKIQTHMNLKADPTIRGIANVVSVCTEEDCQIMKLERLIPMYLDITNQLTEILRVESTSLSTEPTPQQVEAGIHNFEQLGYFNAIDDMAIAYKMSFDDVLEIEYHLIYLKLLRNKISDTFAKRYQEIVRRDSTTK